MTTIKDEVIGVGSLHGWTRGQMLEEYNSIRKSAEEGEHSLEEWMSMEDVLIKMMIGSSCSRFSQLVRLFWLGSFQRMKIEGCAA